MDERDEPVTHETTIINAGSGSDRGGGGATMLAILVALLVGIGAFLYFGGYLGRTSSTELNVNIDTPKVELPDVKVNVPPPATQPAQPSTAPANSH